MSTTPQRDRVHASPDPSVSQPVAEERLKRRRFLLALGAGAAGGAVAVTKAIASPVAGESAADKTGTGTETSGYRETEHVRDYYASARI